MNHLHTTSNAKENVNYGKRGCTLYIILVKGRLMVPEA